MAGSLTITGLSAGEPAGQRTFGPLTIQGAALVDETLAVPLTSGDNTFTVPSGAVACLIVPPSTGTATLKLRTNANSSDAGLTLSPSLPSVYTFPSTPPTSLIINASAPQTTLLSIAFI